MKKIYRAMAGFFSGGAACRWPCLAFYNRFRYRRREHKKAGVLHAGAAGRHIHLQAGNLVYEHLPHARYAFEGEPLAQRLLTHSSARPTTFSSSTATPVPSRAASRWRGRNMKKRGRRSKMSRSLRRKRPAMLRLPIRKPEQKRLRRKRRQGRRAAKLIRSRPRNQPRRIRCRSWITPISPRHSTPEMS